MALTRYGDIQVRYNSYEDTEIKDFLPIIDNEIPNKLIKNFDTTADIVFSEVGIISADYGLDKIKAYKSASCRKVYVGNSAGNQAILTYTPAAAIDLTSLSSSTNNYATIKQSGKYKSGTTSYKDTMFLVLNIGHDYRGGALTTPTSLKVVCYSGTKTATLTTAQNLADSALYTRNTYQMATDSDYFTYAAGFVDADWENITKIDVKFLNGNLAPDVWVHNMSFALPKYAADVTDSYYPEITDSTGIFVSHLFGDDTATGTRTTPVKTIQQAMALIDAAGAGFVYVVIMDSEIYKPVALDYSSVGIKQTLDRNTTIIADYLETPNLSAEPELFNSNRVGSRDNYRTRFYTGAGTTYHVAKTGNDTTGDGSAATPWLTIGKAHTEASADDCIQIDDSGTYDELLTAGKAITLQAAPGYKPTMKKTSGATVLDMASYAVNVYGIIFQGQGAASEQVIKTGTTAAAQKVKDCTFKGIGAATGTATAIRFASITTGALVIENCLFVENGENFIAVECISGTAGTVTIINCIGYMGATANNYFIKEGKATTTYALSVICLGSKILGSVNTTLAYLAYQNDAAASTQYSSVYVLLCDSNMASFATNTGSVLYLQYIKNNYFHDNYRPNTNYFLAFAPVAGASTNSVIGNKFYKIGVIGTWNLVSNNFYVVGTNFNAGVVTNNIFIDCNAVCVTSTNSGAQTIANNVCLGCTIGIRSLVSQSYPGNIMINCTYGFYSETGITTAATTSVYYNAPDGGAGTVTHNSDTNVNPEFIDPDNANFAWYLNSVIETDFTNNGAWLSAFFKPAGAYDLTLKFLEIKGFVGQSISTAAAHVKPQYCYIHDFTVALNSISAQISPQNCLFEDNGIALRYNNATINTTPTCAYNVFDGNNTGILLRSGAAINHCTIVNGDYGIAGIFSGYYALDEYISDYLTISNSIIFDNAVYDYYYTLPTDYCVIGKRYYDMLPDTDVNYKLTVGTHDVTENPVLTGTYFPSLKILGYKANSPAYMAANDGTSNIGARSVNRINAAPAYSSYTFPANPQEYEMRMVPVNLESSTSIDGNYEADSDIEVVQVAFNWTEPGRLSKIMATQKTVMEYVYQTYWIVGISTDDGASWVYYKVNKEVNPSTKQIGFYYSDIPWGEWTMEFFKTPVSFVIADYTVNTMVD